MYLPAACTRLSVLFYIAALVHTRTICLLFLSLPCLAFPPSDGSSTSDTPCFTAFSPPQRENKRLETCGMDNHVKINKYRCRNTDVDVADAGTPRIGVVPRCVVGLLCVRWGQAVPCCAGCDSARGPWQLVFFFFASSDSFSPNFRYAFCA
jgi:hypothetical protein